jgi:hypothetical protein
MAYGNSGPFRLRACSLAHLQSAAVGAHARAPSRFHDGVRFRLARDPGHPCIAVSRLPHVPLPLEEAADSGSSRSKKPDRVIRKEAGSVMPSSRWSFGSMPARCRRRRHRSRLARRTEIGPHGLHAGYASAMSHTDEPWKNRNFGTRGIAALLLIVPCVDVRSYVMPAHPALVAF